MEYHTGVSQQSVPDAAHSRIASLDQFRGLLMFLLIGADYLTYYAFIPVWFKHSQVFGTINVIDLGAPLFIFAVGISLGLVFQRCRTNDEVMAARWRYVRRGLVLIAFGIIGSALMRRGITRDWEIFQTIGLAGIIALPFITLPTRRRIAAAILLMVTFQAINRYDYSDWLRHSEIGGLGGMLGGIAWAGLMLVGSTVSRYLRSDGQKLVQRLILIGSIGAVVAATLLVFQPFDKRLVTMSYLALTAGLAGFVLLLFVALTRRKNFNFPPFTMLGSNALVAFIVHGLGLLALKIFITANSPASAVFTGMVALYIFCYLIVAWLYRRQMFVRL